VWIRGWDWNEREVVIWRKFLSKSSGRGGQRITVTNLLDSESCWTSLWFFSWAMGFWTIEMLIVERVFISHEGIRNSLQGLEE
jgi:hypothetical protein